MAGELGLKNSFATKILKPLNQYRHGSSDKGGRDISLVDFANHQLGMSNTQGNPLTMADIWCDLGLDPKDVSLDHLLSLSGEVKYFAPEVIRDAVLMGMTMNDVNYLDLCAGSVNVDSLDATTPWVQFSDDTPLATGEAETFAEAKLTWGHKSVRLAKKGVSFFWSDEVIMAVKIPLLQQYMQRVGVNLSAAMYTEAVSTLINGDQASGADSCAVIGTANGSTLVFGDILKAWVRARLIGMKWNAMITDETTANSILAMDEFTKPQGFGDVRVNLDSPNRIVPGNVTHLIASGATHPIFFDPTQAMIYLSFRPLFVETERIVMREVTGTKASIIGGYNTLWRHARVMIDKSKSFSGYGFPSWMAPLV